MMTKRAWPFIFPLALAGLTATPALAVNFTTYRAVYDLEPARIQQGTAAQPIDGKVAYEVSGSECAGFTIDSDYTTRYTDGENGGVRTVNTLSNTFESSDSLELDVSQTQTVNKDVTDDTKITAKRPAANTEVQGEQQGTKKQHFTLGPDVLFPTAHQKKLVSEAMAGQTRDVSLVYDGSDGSKLFKVVTFIGKKREPGTYAPDMANPDAQSLKSLASWPFQLGYYDTANPDAETPDFQATFNMYENGVSTEMLFDYGSFSMRGKLSHFETLEPKTCDGSGTAPKAVAQ